MRAPIAVLALLLVAAGADAQYPAQSIDFDRPEAWALKYFTAVSTFTPLGPPRQRRAGSVDLALELGWIPRLSDSERRVGFEGTTLEDLNKTSMFVRPRVAIGLPAGFSIELGWVPPVEMNGGKANLIAAALERQLIDTGVVALGVRAYGQTGHAKGDITCPEEIIGQPAGSEENPLGCLEPSHDDATLSYGGGALIGGVKLGGAAAVHFAAGATYNDVEFEVGANLADGPDNTRMRTHGWTGWAAAGVGAAPSESTWIGVEAFYSPLSVQRPPSTAAKNEDFFNVRALLRYRIN